MDSCDDGVFNTPLEHAPWSHKAIATDSCLPKKGIACQSCQDSCDVRAISFSPRIGGPASPEIDHDVCNGCGACFSVCPTDAIAFTHAETIADTKNSERLRETS